MANWNPKTDSRTARGANQFLCNLCFSLSSTHLWRRGTGRGGAFWKPLSLSLSPLTRREGIQIVTFLPKLCQKLICAQPALRRSRLPRA